MNDITAAKEMPIEAGATYVFDLGYYDYGWWAMLHRAGCRIVTRLKGNTPFTVIEERAVPAGSSILSDRLGYLPKRLAASRNNPMSKLVREVQVEIETGKILRIFTNDLTASAEEIAAFVQAALGHRIILQMDQTDIENQPLHGEIGERGSHSDYDCPDCLSAAAPGS